MAAYLLCTGIVAGNAPARAEELSTPPHKLSGPPSVLEVSAWNGAHLKRDCQTLMAKEKLPRVQQRPEQVTERFLPGGSVADRGEGAAALPGSGRAGEGAEEQLFQHLRIRLAGLQQLGEATFWGADLGVDAVAVHDVKRLGQVGRHVALALA